jgi:hypothetical protein
MAELGWTVSEVTQEHLIWVAPECQDTGRLAGLYHGTFG